MDISHLSDDLRYEIRSYLPPHPLTRVLKDALLWIHNQRILGRTQLTCKELDHLYYNAYYYRCRTKGVIDKNKYYLLKKFYLLNKIY